MTTVTPVDPRATVAAVYDENLDVSGAPIPAGHWRFYTQQWDQDGDPTGIEYGCPCGCGFLFNAPFDAQTPDEKVWEWNGATDGITLRPSILIDQHDSSHEVTGAHWHGFLTNSEFRAGILVAASGSSLNLGQSAEG